MCSILYSNTGLNHHPMVHNKWLCQSRWSLRTGGPSEQGKTNTACSVTSNLQVQNPRLAAYDSKCETHVSASVNEPSKRILKIVYTGKLTCLYSLLLHWAVVAVLSAFVNLSGKSFTRCGKI